ncbi:MAG: insulinase family protein [Planctomycetia bacterium]|nr:insulinase family protein [Planctomycetia bacterium]
MNALPTNQLGTAAPRQLTRASDERRAVGCHWPVGGAAAQQTVLENGIRVVTEEVSGVRSIAFGVLADVGPRQETPAQSGIAHLIEHLVFQGTGSRSAQQIASLMDLSGGQFGGFTTRDYTCYHATVLDEHRTYALDLLGDLLLNSIFAPGSLEREKEAILHEIALGRDTPQQRVQDLLKALAWPDHPLGRDIAGRPETVQAITREDLIYFFHRHYTPDRLIVAAAGNLEHDDVAAQVRDAFWRLLGDGERAEQPAPEQRGGVMLEAAGVSQAYFAVGIPALPYAHPDRYALYIFNQVLGGGVSSRLFRKLREERGLVYHVDADYHAYRDAGMLVVSGSTAPEQLTQVLGMVLLELWRTALGLEAVDEEELWRAKTQVRRQHLLAAECTATRMSRLAVQQLYFGNPIPAGSILDRIEAVDQAALARLGREQLAVALPRTAVAVVAPAAPHLYTAEFLEEMRAGCGIGLRR